MVACKCHTSPQTDNTKYIMVFLRNAHKCIIYTQKNSKFFCGGGTALSPDCIPSNSTPLSAYGAWIPRLQHNLKTFSISALSPTVPPLQKFCRHPWMVKYVSFLESVMPVIN